MKITIECTVTLIQVDDVLQSSYDSEGNMGIMHVCVYVCVYVCPSYWYEWVRVGRAATSLVMMNAGEVKKRAKADDKDV